MRSMPARFRLPTALEEVFKTRAKELGYESVSEYVLGLVRYDLLTRKDHHATKDIAQLSRAEQDKIDDEIVRAFAAGESIGGSWFENRIKQAAEEAGLRESPAPSRVAERLARKLRGKG